LHLRADEPEAFGLRRATVVERLAIDQAERAGMCFAFVEDGRAAIDEAMRLAPPGTENGALAMMVFSYWEQACAYLNHGLLHEDLFFETSGEFFGVWDLVKGIVPEGRARFSNKLFLANVEKAAQRYESWIESRSPGHIAAMRQMMKQMREQRAKTAKA